MKWNGLKRSPIRKVSKEQTKELALRIKLKKELIAEMEYPHCQTCLGNGDIRGLSLSHIIPLSRGGKTTRENCLIECYPCHEKYEKKPGLREQEHPELFENNPELREAHNGIKNDDGGVDTAT